MESESSRVEWGWEQGQQTNTTQPNKAIQEDNSSNSVAWCWYLPLYLVIYQRMAISRISLCLFSFGLAFLSFGSTLIFGVQLPYVGPMPHPPPAPLGVANPAGSFSIPQSTLNFGGHPFDCAGLLNTYLARHEVQAYVNPPLIVQGQPAQPGQVSKGERGNRQKGMIGVAVARHPNDNLIRAYITRSGEAARMPGVGGMPALANVANAQPGWTTVDIDEDQRRTVRERLRDEFGTAPRRCFGTPSHPWRQQSGLNIATQPTCAWSPDTAPNWREREAIARRWPVGR